MVFRTDIYCKPLPADLRMTRKRRYDDYTDDRTPYQ
jgi:hypothetical protein